MKKLLLFILPLLAVTFNSCSKDDDSGNTYGKLVQSIVTIGDYGTTAVYFSYDDKQRITQFAQYSEDDVYICNLTYDDNKITAIYEDYSGVYTFTLTNSYVTKFDSVDSEYGNHNYYRTFEYSNGYLAKTLYPQAPEESITYIWSGGNMTEQIFSDGGVETYTYTNKSNKLNVDFFEFNGRFINFNCPIVFNGMRMKNLPLSVPSIYGDDRIEYTYVIDNDGYPTMILGTSSDGESYTSTITYH